MVCACVQGILCIGNLKRSWTRKTHWREDARKELEVSVHVHDDGRPTTLQPGRSGGLYLYEIVIVLRMCCTDVHQNCELCMQEVEKKRKELKGLLADQV